MLSRRTFLVATAGGLTAACTTNTVTVGTPVQPAPIPVVETVQLDPDPDLTPVRNGMPAMYGPLPDELFPVPAVKPGVVPKKFWRTRVPDPTGEAPGTVVIDPNAKYLHLVEPGGTAMRYGIGVGKAGFEWAGNAKILDKREWPTWTPPDEMIARDPSLEKFSAANGGQPPGLDNALGARAMYLYQGRVDTLYRIHGTPVAESIGRSMSSGCIRMLNQDVIDLYNRVPLGTPVVVRQSSLPDALAGAPGGPIEESRSAAVPRAEVVSPVESALRRRQILRRLRRNRI